MVNITYCVALIVAVTILTGDVLACTPRNPDLKRCSKSCQNKGVCVVFNGRETCACVLYVYQSWFHGEFCQHRYKELTQTPPRTRCLRNRFYNTCKPDIHYYFRANVC